VSSITIISDAPNCGITSDRIYAHNMFIIHSKDISDEEKSFITSTLGDQFGLRVTGVKARGCRVSWVWAERQIALYAHKTEFGTVGCSGANVIKLFCP